jgi:uncharacterized protein (DUF2147 family)
MSLRPIVATSVILIACAVSVPASSSPESPSFDESGALAAKYPPESILGEWVTEAQENRPPGRIKFVHAQDGTYLGIVSWAARPQKDVNNKDPKLRDRPVLGMVIMWHLRYDDGEYVDGYVYNPEDGGTYRMKAEVLSPASLRIRGYLGISLFGENQTWSRYQQ